MSKVISKKILSLSKNSLGSIVGYFSFLNNKLVPLIIDAKIDIQLKDNKISEITIDPRELNIKADKFENLVGDDAKFNADKLINIFKGEDNDFSKAVCLNAAAGLIVSEKYDDFKLAYNYTRDFIRSGKSYKHLMKIQNG